MKTFTLEQVSKHNSRHDCWVVIHGKVYDLTRFLDEHPGGSRVILREAGKDATAAFDPIHPQDIIDRFLPKECFQGLLDQSSVPQTTVKALVQVEKPQLSSVLNIFDFEGIAKKCMKPEAWAYYSSGAEDEITLRENHAAFHRIWLKPRVLVNVKNVDTSTRLLGASTSIPLYISATALGKLGHPEGEVVLTRAAGTRKIVQMIPTLASCSLDEMTKAALPEQTQWFQLYVNSDKTKTRQLVERAEQRGCKALFITVDAPALGKREKDMRLKFVDDAPDEHKQVERTLGAARAISSFIDPSLQWSDIQWFKSITRLPIFLKGIQSGSDAVLAAKHGVAGIVISNHGGRQLDTVRSGIEILPEVVNELKSAGLRDKLNVFVDGGFRRGSDIYKAIALGADAVGIGRPVLYAMSTFGQEGVEHCLDLLKEELEMTMRLMGTPTIQHIRQQGQDLLITSSLSSKSGNLPKDNLTSEIYEKMATAIKPKL